MDMPQPQLRVSNADQSRKTYRERLVALLSQDLNFHGQDSGYASHNFHSFPAKFPPQLPRRFIKSLTTSGDLVLDPMMGSGTTVLEAFLMGRQAVGFDIDPLALVLAKTKVTPLDTRQVAQLGNQVLKQAATMTRERRSELERVLKQRWDSKTLEFVNYWFARETQLDLLALMLEIEQIDDASIRVFFELAFSAIIITKSGGVSLAFDLAHTRPHRAKVVIDGKGQVILGHDVVASSSRRIKFLTKTLRPVLKEFEKRFDQNLEGLLEFESNRIQPYLTGLLESEPDKIQPYIMSGNAQSLSLDDNSIDLIVTSPPYASNAIDYMRAHKFSLVWMGYPIDDLGKKRKEYIGGEAVTNYEFVELPDRTSELVAAMTDRDKKKGRVLHRYYSEMTRTLQEMFRVLKPGKAAIVVVASSTMRGKDTETQTCLAEIGREIGFEIPKIGIRDLDRNRRMMPAGTRLNLNSQIQQRMHKEYVIGFYKSKA